LELATIVSECALLSFAGHPMVGEMPDIFSAITELVVL